MLSISSSFSPIHIISVVVYFSLHGRSRDIVMVMTLCSLWVLCSCPWPLYYRLQFLPTTLGSCNLKALWLSENQAQPMLKFQTDIDEASGQEVLTCTIVYRCTCCTHGDGWSLTFFQILQWYSLYLHVGLHVWHWLSMQRTLSGDVNRSQFWPVPPRNLLQVLMLIQSSETSLFSHVEQLNVLQYLVGLSVQPCDAL